VPDESNSNYRDGEILGFSIETHQGTNEKPDFEETKQIVKTFLDKLSDSKETNSKKMDIVDLLIDIIEELDPRQQDTISSCINMTNYLQVNVLSQNNKDFLAKQLLF